MKILNTQFRLFIFIFPFLLVISPLIFAQSIDSISSKKNKNSIKFNVTNTLLYDNSYQIPYERILKQNQSLNVFVGYQEFPLISIELVDVNFDKKSSRKGFSVGADYRFYLGNINKYNGPRGVYFAPFASFFQFETDRELIHTDSNTGIVSTANLTSKLNLTNFGGELGYQFVLRDRFVVDCVFFGPSITRYKYNVKLDNEISGLDENELYQKIIEAIKNKFPDLGSLTTDGGIEKKGA
jgi:hypothetical protein